MTERGGRIYRSSRSLALGANDPRHRRDPQGAQTDIELKAPLYVTNDGRIALDVSGALEVGPDGKLFIRAGGGLTVAPGSPLTLQIQFADDSLELTRLGIQARPSTSQIRVAQASGLQSDTLTEALSTEVEKLANKDVSNGYAGLDSSGFVPVSKGGTGKGSYSKGDLLVGGAGTTFNTVSLGTNGYVLTADNTVGAGVKWAAASGGGGLSQDEVLTLMGWGGY